MKHKHADIAKAKLDNVNLVLFAKHESSDKWAEIAYHGDIAFLSNYEYFLCLPQHKEACLHWLNGWKVQYTNGGVDGFFDIEYSHKEGDWSYCHAFMQLGAAIRIKPRKQKRYVVFHKGSLVNELFEFDADIRASYGSEYQNLQIFPIEVEV